MSTASDLSSVPINPRPGVVKTLGICNIVFSALLSACMLSSTFWLFALSVQPPQPKVQVTTAPQPGNQVMVAFNPFMGMDDPRFLRFCYIDVGTGVIINGIMFATGIGLINLRGWAARWWTVLAWTKIVRLTLLWGYFIVGVTPSLSANMAKAAMSMLQQGMVRGRGPTVADLTRIYSITNLVLAVSMIALGSIYPAISLWVLSRPGAQAALIDKSAQETELP